MVQNRREHVAVRKIRTDKCLKKKNRNSKETSTETPCSAERTLNWYDTTVSLHLARRWTVRWDWARRWAHIKLSSGMHADTQAWAATTKQSIKTKRINQTGAGEPASSDTVNISWRIPIIRVMIGERPPQVTWNTKAASLGSAVH